MCQEGKIGIWLTPEEARVIASGLELLLSRFQLASVEYMERLLAEAQAQKPKPDEEGEEEPEPDEDDEDEESRPVTLPARERELVGA